MHALVGVLHFEMSNFPFFVVVLHPSNITLRKKMNSENFLLGVLYARLMAKECGIPEISDPGKRGPYFGNTPP